ncbi:MULTISPECIES: ABC transporter permease [Lactiplantibacillus]|uniref:FtsX-like permease family protein n=1 Tax=Lactiplantibacillus pentosus TaxID=1589 RepID=A0AAW8WBM6_LACPE|nr:MULTISPECIES: ABC transporter permease [Lactiplantibacillus]AUI77830.1 ABC transporter permease [Lactiplantibacillus pentosus]MBU7461599.1 ABC transporter permease [Lactiplantibacillus pentosus]MBU7477684.1 ABC transporter permease [Lactiplantibacillus pentosus]MBU7484267.1 ABC transporter permease [Lactiplantibacillus sp. 30.2.29]MBU7487540.1 ABC transporter permease [Lactiplantibacillus pentosus]
MTAAYFKTIMREIWSSKARFASILLIIFLGVAFYTGIRATGPDMSQAANDYYKQQKLATNSVQSTLGLTKSDTQVLAKHRAQLTYQAAKYVDVNQLTNSQVIRVMALPKTQRLNQLRVVSGRLPRHANEIVLDAQAKRLQPKLKIGSTYRISSTTKRNQQFTRRTFKVVGFVNSPTYVENTDRGVTNVGKGTLDYLVYVRPQVLKSSVITRIDVQFKNLRGVTPYTAKYRRLNRKNTAALKRWLKPQAKKRQQQLQAQATAKIKPLQQATKQLESQVPAGTAQLVKLQTQLKQAQAKVAAIKAPTYLYTDRSDNPGYTEYHENTQRVVALSTVFPLFFIAIAALICLTTMTRMVEELRLQMGTLKALGYSNTAVGSEFMVYGGLAALIGTALGVAFGVNFFPRFIAQAYGSMYNLPAIHVQYIWLDIVIALLIALLCTLGTALVVLRVDLRALPASLLQPRAPKAGKTLLLERWRWLWRRLSFNHKITIRNLFRYKQRLLMTVLGIAGCMAMMITGFGLKDSIGDISVKQFNQLWHYDAIVTRSGQETAQQRRAISKGSTYRASMKLQAKQVTVKQAGVAEQTATLGIPAAQQHLSKFVVLRHRQSHQAIQLGTHGAVIDEKLAKLYGVQAGDQLTIKVAGQPAKKIRVSAIAENYVNHFIYMSPTYYRQVFKQAPVYNTNYVQFKNASTKQQNAYADRLLKQTGIQNVTLMSTEKATNFKMLDSMNLVVLIFVVSAGALALVVLYNLTNINVSERIRELSTIKVLGFYDGEVTMYIFRENLILTVLGMLVGCFLGNWLHAYILQTAETNALMFSPTIHPLSYIYSALLTLAFSLLVMAMMHWKLKRVNMLDALKSVD